MEYIQRVKFILSLLIYTRFVIGHNIRVQLNTLIYKKILRLSSQGYSQTSVGTMVNYVANDTMFYERAAFHFGIMISAPFALGTSIPVLIYMTGVPGVIGTVAYLFLFARGISIFRYVVCDIILVIFLQSVAFEPASFFSNRTLVLKINL